MLLKNDKVFWLADSQILQSILLFMTEIFEKLGEQIDSYLWFIFEEFHLVI